MWIPASKTLAGWAVIGVGAIAAAVHFGVPEQRNVPGPVASSPAREAPALASAPAGSLAELLASARRAPLSRGSVGQLFGVHEARAPQIEAAPVPAKPVAPPFPFKYAGWLQERTGAAKVFLSRGNTVFPIKAGDVLEGFRIDAVQDERIEVTYLASGQQLSFLLASLAGAADGAMFADASGTAGLPPQSAAVQGSSSGGGAASTPGASQAAAPGGGFVPAPRSAGLISHAISVAENAPLSGSMPTGPSPGLGMQLGPVSSGAFPAGSAPSGKLGVEPAASGKLGSEAVPRGKLGS